MLLSYGCVGTREAERACLAQGERCSLAPWPERHPCAGQGTRCRDDQMRELLRDPPCGCTCSTAFRQREEAVRDRSEEPQCRELHNLNDGTVETVCKPPELPR